ncbi:MAG: hypothetical protein ACREIA_17950 [Opitutaceae bacterium]
MAAVSVLAATGAGLVFFAGWCDLRTGPFLEVFFTTVFFGVDFAAGFARAFPALASFLALAGLAAFLAFEAFAALAAFFLPAGFVRGVPRAVPDFAAFFFVFLGDGFFFLTMG